MIERCLKLIRDTAQIPSFSSFEERIHPYIYSVAEHIEGCETTTVEQRNLILRVPGTAPGRIALTAHLDKINHFGEKPPERLRYERHETYIRGQLDNTVGIGIALTLLETASVKNWPEILVLLSEMEESTGLREHPELMRNRGEGLHHGMGAERIAQHLIDEELFPAAVITIDTTPLFKGKPGCALYAGHWEFTKTEPTAAERDKTEALTKRLLEADPGLHQANNTNDYLTYGKVLNTETGAATDIPSVAVEPAIHPYHQQNEQVFIADINRVLHLLERFLDAYTTGK